MRKSTSTAWKGIAITSVLLGHLNLLPLGGVLGVIIFLVVSGYGISASTVQNGLTGFWKRRVSTVLIPFIVWETAAALVNFLLSPSGNASISQIVLSVLALKPGSVIDSQWYVTYIMLVYIIYYIFTKHSVRTNSKAMYLCVACTAFGIMALGNVYFPRYSTAWYYAICFPVGVLLYHETTTGAKKFRDKRWLVLLIVIAIVMYFLSLNTDGIMKIVYTMILSIDFALLVSVLMVSCDFNSKVAQFLGRYSYWIFLNNTFTISRIRDMFLEEYLDFTVLHKLITLIIVIVTGVLLDRLYSKGKILLLRKK